MQIDLHEFSANFDLENVRPFLERLRDHAGIEFDIDLLVSFTAQTSVDDDREMRTTARFEGAEHKCAFRVFMDDIDAPDIYIFSQSKALIDAINRELDAFWDELGI